MARSPSAQKAKKSPVPVNIFIAAIFPTRWRAQTVARRFLRGRGGGAGTAWNKSRRHSEHLAVLHREHDAARPVMSGLDAAVYWCGGRWMQCCSHHLLWYRRRGDGWRPTPWGGGRGSDVEWCSCADSPPGCCGMGSRKKCALFEEEWWSFVMLEWALFLHSVDMSNTPVQSRESVIIRNQSLKRTFWVSSWIEISSALRWIQYRGCVYFSSS